MAATTIKHISRTLDRLPAAATIPWHRHGQPYAAIIIDGRLEEIGEQGRRLAGPGDVMVHAPYDAHHDQAGRHAVSLINVPLPYSPTDAVPSGTLAGVAQLTELATLRPVAAVAWLRDRVQPTVYWKNDWPDLLARELHADPCLLLGEWAERAGVRRETVSRQFASAYKVTPKTFRAAVRARLAWKQLVFGRARLSDIAQECGFADQPHMCRVIKDMTGRTPGYWRASNGFKTGYG